MGLGGDVLLLTVLDHQKFACWITVSDSTESANVFLGHNCCFCVGLTKDRFKAHPDVDISDRTIES